LSIPMGSNRRFDVLAVPRQTTDAAGAVSTLTCTERLDVLPPVSNDPRMPPTLELAGVPIQLSSIQRAATGEKTINPSPNEVVLVHTSPLELPSDRLYY